MFRKHVKLSNLKQKQIAISRKLLGIPKMPRLIPIAPWHLDYPVETLQRPESRFIYAFNRPDTELEYRLLGGVSSDNKCDIFSNSKRWDWIPSSQTVSVPSKHDCGFDLLEKYQEFSQITNLDEVVRMFLLSMLVVGGHESIPEFLRALLKGIPNAATIQGAIDELLTNRNDACVFYKALANNFYTTTPRSGIITFYEDHDLKLPDEMIEINAMSAYIFYNQNEKDKAEIGLIISEGSCFDPEFDFVFNRL